MAYNGAKNKTRINLTIEKDLKEKAESIAKEESRSFNSLVIHAIKTYIKNRDHD